MSHTPGPWTMRCGNGITAITTPIGEMQISLYSEKLNPRLSVSIQEWEANANLMAAAPDLLEALVEMYEEMKEYVAEDNFNNGGDAGQNYRNKKADAAIAKATTPNA